MHRNAGTALLFFILALAIVACKPAPKVTEATSRPVDATLSQQETCASAARELFHADHYNETDNTEYQNHYSAELGHCYMVVTTTVFDKQKPSVSVTRTLLDVFEHHAVGECIATGPGPAMMEVIGVCNMDQPNGENRMYNSPWAWLNAAKPYFGRVP